MNQHRAHSFRLHHAGATDVMDARRRVVATYRASDLWNRFSLLWKHCSHRNSDLVTVVTLKVTITVTHLTEIAWRITRASDSSPRGLSPALSKTSTLKQAWLRPSHH
jgi:hypothetical protein